MAPKVVKGAKSNDLRMFFGPGGSQPKQVQVKKSVPAPGEKRYVESPVASSFLLKPGIAGVQQIPHLCP